VRNFSIVWIITYLWVIISMPMHHHIKDEHISPTTSCSHTNSEQKNKDHVVSEDCAICFNLHVPNALNILTKVECVLFTTDYIADYNSTLSSTWENIDIYKLSNKDPPLS